uniref:Putative secreted protein n=1 Tax=Anopheles marajoara TaxID=58244 RepID=A0A2M4C6U5_9DIPT
MSNFLIAALLCALCVEVLANSYPPRKTFVEMPGHALGSFGPGQGKIVPKRGPPVSHIQGNIPQPKIGVPPPPAVHVGTKAHGAPSYSSGPIKVGPKRVPQGPHNHGSGQFVKNYPPAAAAAAPTATHFGPPPAHASSFGVPAHAGGAHVGGSNHHAAKHTQVAPAIGHGPGGAYEHRRTHAPYAQPQHG